MNAFDAFGQQHARKAKPTRERGPRSERSSERLEKQQAEDNALMKRYRRLIREERERCYAMPGGADALEVVRWARKMTLEDGDTLVIKVRRLRPERMAKELRFGLLSDSTMRSCGSGCGAAWPSSMIRFRMSRTVCFR